MRDLKEIIVHCSATRPSWMERLGTKTKVKEIRRWHLERGFRDIGYHFLIDRDGTLAEGRPLDKAGAHVAGHNAHSVGICLIGGHGSSMRDEFLDNFTPEQERELLRLIETLKDNHPTITKVNGHNMYSDKACPGFLVIQCRSRNGRVILFSCTA